MSSLSQEKLLIYAAIPTQMTGEELLPLTILKQRHPEIGGAAHQKYEGREIVTSIKVPPDDAAWLDHVFLSSCPPSLIFNALVKAGLDPKEHCHEGRQQFYAFTWEELRSRSSGIRKVAFLNKHPPIKSPTKGDSTLEMDPRDWFQLGEMEDSDVEKLLWVDKIPEGLHDYYKKIADGKIPGKAKLWHLLPHVLVRGPIDCRNATIVEWKD